MKRFLTVMFLLGHAILPVLSDTLASELAEQLQFPLRFQDAILQISRKNKIKHEALDTTLEFSAAKYMQQIAEGLEKTTETSFRRPNISAACLTAFKYFSSQLVHNRSQWALEGWYSRRNTFFIYFYSDFHDK
jgi:hypothetical protein